MERVDILCARTCLLRIAKAKMIERSAARRKVSRAIIAGEASAEQRTLYDASGKVIGRTSTDSQGTVTTYDVSGKVIQRETRGDGQTVIYDAQGRVTGRRAN